MMGNDLPKSSMLWRHPVRRTRLRFSFSGLRPFNWLQEVQGSRPVELAFTWRQLVHWSVLLPALYFYLGLAKPLYPSTGRLCEVALQPHCLTRDSR
jgi:hypothetical protein